MSIYIQITNENKIRLYTVTAENIETLQNIILPSINKIFKKEKNVKILTSLTEEGDKIYVVSIDTYFSDNNY